MNLNVNQLSKFNFTIAKTAVSVFDLNMFYNFSNVNGYSEGKWYDKNDQPLTLPDPTV